MKVRELIEALQPLDQEAEVYTEGCDCIGDTGFVTCEPSETRFADDKPCVVICRSEGDIARNREARNKGDLGKGT